LKHYIEEVLHIEKYQVTDEETGVIPMTNFRFSGGKNNIINIGTAGGQTKGSSGYTFNFIQRHSAALVQSMISTGEPSISNTRNRFHFYDSVLLNILQRNTLPGNLIFSRLFERNPAANVLRFLDNHSTLSQDLKIISTLPTMPFLKAAMQQIF
jgi:lycopene beta-cyclase